MLFMYKLYPIFLTELALVLFLCNLFITIYVLPRTLYINTSILKWRHQICSLTSKSLKPQSRPLSPSMESSLAQAHPSCSYMASHKHTSSGAKSHLLYHPPSQPSSLICAGMESPPNRRRLQLNLTNRTPNQ